MNGLDPIFGTGNGLVIFKEEETLHNFRQQILNYFRKLGAFAQMHKAHARGADARK